MLSSFDFETFANIAGIAGFILSLVLAIITYFQQRTKISVESVCAYAHRLHSNTLSVILRCTLSNRSSSAISITGVSVSDKQKIPWNAVKGSRIIWNKSDDFNTSSLKNTPLPIMLSPYESADCFFLFSFPASSKETPQLPLCRTSRHGVLRIDLDCERLDTDPVYAETWNLWDISLILHTSRRTVLYSNLRVPSEDASELNDELSC